MKFRFSVLIPIKGDSPFLVATLESINANKVEKEIVIVDDGATTIAKNALNSFSSKYPDVALRVLENEGRGLTNALNTGLRYCRAPLIARIDSDDLMEVDRLEMQLREFEANHELIVLGTQCTYIDTTGEKIGRSNYPNGLISKEALLSFGNLLAHPSVAYRKSEIEALGGYEEFFSWFGADLSQDYSLWLKVADKGLIINSSSLLSQYRIHNGQVSNEFSTQQVIAACYVSILFKNPELEKRRLSFGHSNYSSILHLARVILREYGLVATSLVTSLIAFMLVHQFAIRKLGISMPIKFITGRLTSLLINRINSFQIL